MTTFNVENYLNSLFEGATTINLSDRGITYLPDMRRFKKLERLYCSGNKLTSLPDNLPESLIFLCCNNNNLTSLPDMRRFINLEVLSCGYNKLTFLPDNLPDNLVNFSCDNNELSSITRLPRNLRTLCCRNNKLTSLPSKLPGRLQVLYCDHNNLTFLPNLHIFLEIFVCGYNKFNYPFNFADAYDVKNYFNLFMLIDKIKIINKFRYLYGFIKIKNWLWKRIMEKIIEPKILKKYHPSYLIENLNEETDLDMVLSNW